MSRKNIPNFSFYPLFVAVWVMFLFGACSRTVTHSPNTPETNFEHLWQDFDRFYVSFEIKGIDWDSVYAVYRPLVTPQRTDREMIGIMAVMLETLKDGHVNLITPMGGFGYDGWKEPFPVNYNSDVVRMQYLGGAINAIPRRTIMYQTLDSQIGYIHINTFRGEGWGGDIELALEVMPEVNGLILDVRSNGGGNIATAEDVAGRFTNERRVYGFSQSRNGPGHGDLTVPDPVSIEPQGLVKFVKPIVVLTNRGTFSSAELFVQMLQTLSYVTVVGDTTGGGVSSPQGRELPNGLTYTVPTTRFLTLDQQSYEGVGLAPEIWVSTPNDVLNSGRDFIFEKAIEILSNP